MKKLDIALGGFLVLLGCVHNFIAAPLTYDRLTTPALWFVAAGLSLWYAGFINLLRAFSKHPERLLLWFCAITNLTLLAFVVTFVAWRGKPITPDALALMASVLALTIISLRAFASR